MANLYIVHHNYDAEKSDELTLQVGDIISVSDNSDPGWWVGEKVKDGQAGWFPANFVDPHEEQPAAPAVAAPPAPADPVPAVPVEDDVVTAPAAAESAAPPAPKNEGPVLARVEYDYEAKESGELSLEVGRVVTILDSSDPAWWTGDLNGKVGTFPSNYVKLLEHKEESADTGDKPAKFKLAAFGVKQGGLGSLFAGGVVPGLKKTGGLKKLGGVSEPAAPAPAVGGMAKRTSVDEPRSPVVAAAPPKISPPVAPLIAHHTPARATPPAPAPAPATPPAPVEEPVTAQEPRVPSRAKKPKSKQIRAVVIYDYTAQEDDEITLVKGSTIVVTDKMGDEGWWSGRNEDGEVGNFPSDFVEEIKEEAVLSPKVAPAAPVPIPAPIAVPAPAPAPVAQEEAPKSPVQSRTPIHAPVPLPVVPAEPLRVEPVRTRTNEAPMATPPAIPRGSRPPSMISSPTPSSAQLHDARASIDGPPLPSSPPPKRMSTISRTSSRDVPGSPRLASVPVFPNPEKPIPEAPSTEAPETSEEHVAADTSEPPTSNSNRNSYILPTPVARNRPLPPLARPPSIHSITENRRSIASPPVGHLPPVLSEAEEPEPVHEDIIEEEDVEVHHAPEAPVHEEETVEHQEEPEEPVPSQEEHKEAEQEEETVTDAAAVEEPVEEEKEPEKPKLPELESTGPALSHVSRPRPAKGRKPPTAPVPAETSSFKFPTPFAGAQPASISLRPTGRRTDSGNEGPLSPVNSSSSSAGSPANAPTPAAGVAPPAGGVKSLSSRFGQFQGVPASGGNSAALELEIAKLRRWMTEELDRVKKELSDEREAREKLQEEVNQLKAQLQG
ncbi:SH3-domain kinase binding protein 1 [Linnemannia elongata]|nr:SH3-domain kinase binding protein 1 [Linnemannia elongata]